MEKLQLEELTFGADPELILGNEKTGSPVSAIPIMPGTKHNPIPIEDILFSQDNVLLEFATPVCRTFEELKAKVNRALEIVNTQILPKNVAILNTSSAIYPAKELKDPIAKTFGCDPDLCLYGPEEYETRSDANAKIRSAGGHIHFGFNIKKHNPVKFLRIIDAILGSIQTIVASDTERMKLYGRAGTFRPKRYGFEYRTLNNFWIRSAEDMQLIENGIKIAIDLYNQNIPIDNYTITIRNIINKADRMNAVKLLKELTKTIEIENSIKNLIEKNKQLITDPKKSISTYKTIFTPMYYNWLNAEIPQEQPRNLEEEIA